MLRAISTRQPVSPPIQPWVITSQHFLLPLRECLIASNMSPLAGLAAFAGLGVALAGGSSSWSGHLDNIPKI